MDKISIYVIYNETRNEFAGRDYLGYGGRKDLVYTSIGSARTAITNIKKYGGYGNYENDNVIILKKDITLGDCEIVSNKK
jgi:hypothetical protein